MQLVLLSWEAGLMLGCCFVVGRCLEQSTTHGCRSILGRADCLSVYVRYFGRYIPIVPMVLINGAEGIGTGWSTSVPNYNPRDVVGNIK